MLKSRALLVPVLLAVGFLGLIYWLYLPGLSGGFYLDDWPNLQGLALVNQGHPGLVYLLDSPVGGSGRSIAYLSFLAQHEHWPTNPAAFKLVNLFFHLACAVLVGICGYFIASLRLDGAASKARIVFIALLAGFVWAALPLHVSTVLYVVQRMTQISSLMMLFAFVGYLLLRYRYSKWSRREYALATIAVGVGYLGVFAKEQAVLTGLLILVIEWTLISGLRPRLNRLWFWTVLLLPALLVIGYLLLSNRVLGGYGNRDFTMAERLLTQTVVLWDYVSKIFVPSPGRLNLFNDDFQLSAGLFSPPKTFLSLLGLLLVVTSALVFRKRWPLFSFGALFFVVGHLLESSFIALEIYFEHRNYLPSVGLIIALVVGLGHLLTGLRESHRRASLAALSLGLCWVGINMAVLSVEAMTWGEPRKFAVAALTERPGSLRARQEVAASFVGAGEYQAAAEILYDIEQDFGTQTGVLAQLLVLSCHDSEVSLPERDHLLRVFISSPFDTGTEVALHDVYTLKRLAPDSLCAELSWEEFLVILDSLNENPEYEKNTNIALLRVFVLIELRDYAGAMVLLDRLLSVESNAHLLLFKAKVAGMGGHWDLAIRTLADAEERFQGSIQWYILGDEIRQLRKDFAAESADDSLSLY